MLAPKETCKHCATFCPQFARVYDDFATCTYSDKPILSTSEDSKLFSKVMKIEGVGKYPYVIVKSSESHDQTKAGDVSVDQDYHDMILDFGSVAVGNSIKKCVVISNPSPVRI